MKKQGSWLIGLALALSVGFAAPTAWSATCGMSVTEDLTLTENLDCATGPALIVEASGVDLDLQYHVVSGGGSGPAIVVTDVSKVTIRRGFVTGFESGLVLEGANRARVRELVISEVRWGVIGEARKATVEQCTIHTELDGVRLSGDKNRALNNIVRGRRPNPSVGIQLNGRSYEIRGNVVSGFASGIIGLGDGVVAQNSVFGNREGFWGPGDDGRVTLKNNLFFGNEIGVLVRDQPRASVKVVGNEASMNEVDGFHFFDVTAGGDLLFARNRAVDNGGSGFLVDQIAGSSCEMRFNNAEHNAGHGFHVVGDVALRGNRALDNLAFGINASGGAVDEGGNVASQNGSPTQCSGVACS